MADLTPGMELKGIVTNVTAFGAFVDIGVHQDGLIHISQLSDRYISDPSEVTQAGDRITVWVMDVDLPRKRISLTTRKPGLATAATGSKPGATNTPRPTGKPAAGSRPTQTAQPRFSSNPFANL